MKSGYHYRILSEKEMIESHVIPGEAVLAPPFTEDTFIKIAQHYWDDLGGYDNSVWPVLVVIYSSDNGEEIKRQYVDVETKVDFRVLE